MYRQVAQKLGIEWYPPTAQVEIPNDRTENYLRAIKDNTDRDVQFNITVFPSRCIFRGSRWHNTAGDPSIIFKETSPPPPTS